MQRHPVDIETPSTAVKRRLSHPVIDVDAHVIEYWPALERLVAASGREFGCAELLADGAAVRQVMMRGRNWDTNDGVRPSRSPRGPWWGIPTETRDLATALLPALLSERLVEAGIDFSVVYPSYGLSFLSVAVPEARRALCRAANRHLAETFAGTELRLCPVAVVPMHTPEEALAELDYAVEVLGMRAAVFAGLVLRGPGESNAAAPWFDTFGIDSLHDYSPVWARCAELGIPFAAHSGTMGHALRQSPSSYVYNHIGSFASAGEALAKSLLLGGVPVRHPTLRFVFLEGGVSWAAQLYADLRAHWEKRNRDAIENYNPTRTDFGHLAELFARYGTGPVDPPRSPGDVDWLQRAARPPGDSADEFRASHVESVGALDAVFERQLYFGCEADDRLLPRLVTMEAPRLQAVLGSDIGHWDVPDLGMVLAEAYEPVERGALQPADFERFVFRNPADLYASGNPAFFEGTGVAAAVRAHLAKGSRSDAGAASPSLPHGAR